MSETWQGPGWWQASDGRWYPPHLYPRFVGAKAEPEPRSVLASRLTILISALFVVIGSLLPWAQIFGISVNGTAGDGKITLALGFLNAICALACLSRQLPATIVLAIVAAVLGVVSLIVAVYDWNQIHSAGVSVGSGLDLVALGSLGILAGVVVAVTRR